MKVYQFEPGIPYIFTPSQKGAGEQFIAVAAERDAHGVMTFIKPLDLFYGHPVAMDGRELVSIRDENGVKYCASSAAVAHSLTVAAEVLAAFKNSREELRRA